jgi:hypothetical protein
MGVFDFLRKKNEIEVELGELVEVPCIDACTIVDEIGEDTMDYLTDMAFEEDIDEQELVLCYVAQEVI